MAARVQVVVEAKDATGGVFRALTSQLGAFGGVVEELTTKNANWGSIGQMAAQLVVDGMKDAIKVTTEYAQDVRDLSLASGQGAEAASRMLQVLDDYQLTAEDAATATRAMTKEGLAPTIETIAQLSKQYQKLTDAQEKNEFIQKKLGRAGKEWMNLLSQGPEAIMAMNDAVSEGLILTEDNVKAAEEYRLALDEWNDAVMKLKVSIGNELLPVLTDLMNRDFDKAMERGAEATGVAGLTVKTFTENAKQANPEVQQLSKMVDDLALSEKELAEQQKLAEEALKATTSENKTFLSTLASVTSAMKSYRDGQAEANAALEAGDITIDEHAAKMDALAATYEQAKNQIVLSLIEMKLAADGAFDDSDLNAYLAAGQKLGVFTQGMVTETKRLYNEATQTGKALTDTGSIMYHTGERAVDASYDLGVMADGATTLGDAVRKDATPAVSGLKSQLNGLPVSGSAWEYNFTINVKGQVPKVATASYSTSAGYNTNVHAGGGGQQQGGEVYAGIPTTVHEAGREIFVPQQNGRILGHAESLHAMGLGGGMGGTNYFYGNVTIMADSATGNDLMSIR